MSVTRSEEYYFPGGDLVLEIEGALFRIHRDIISLYSDFFRDMFSTPTSDKKEGTSDEHPLRLPSDLCQTAEAFTTLCKFICPKKLGELPTVRIQDLDAWEPVLEATLALQMADIRAHIISKFKSDTTAIPSEAIRLLTWVMRPEIECNELKLDCIRALVYRRLPITSSEAAVLGTKTTSEIMYIREQVRTFLSARTTPITISAIYCTTRKDCEEKILKAIIQNMTTDWMSRPDQGKLDIFLIDNFFACQTCTLNRNYLAGSLKQTSGELDKEIVRCAKVVGLYA